MGEKNKKEDMHNDLKVHKNEIFLAPILNFVLFIVSYA